VSPGGGASRDAARTADGATTGQGTVGLSLASQSRVGRRAPRNARARLAVTGAEATKRIIDSRIAARVSRISLSR